MRAGIIAAAVLAVAIGGAAEEAVGGDRLPVSADR